MLYALTDEQVARISTLLDTIEADPSGRPGVSTLRRMSASRICVGLVDSQISATTALTGKPKVGTLNVYSFSSTGSADTGRDETVYNFAPQAATTDRWTVAERDSYTGKWVITTQFCS